MVTRGGVFTDATPHFYIMKVEEKYKLNQGYFSPVMSSSAIRT
nr:MAG TPA: hypothetical protein [Caudoviricetes sp.]